MRTLTLPIEPSHLLDLMTWPRRLTPGSFWQASLAAAPREERQRSALRAGGRCAAKHTTHERGYLAPLLLRLCNTLRMGLQGHVRPQPLASVALAPGLGANRAALESIMSITLSPTRRPRFADFRVCRGPRPRAALCGCASFRRLVFCWRQISYKGPPHATPAAVPGGALAYQLAASEPPPYHQSPILTSSPRNQSVWQGSERRSSYACSGPAQNPRL